MSIDTFCLIAFLIFILGFGLGMTDINMEE